MAKVYDWRSPVNSLLLKIQEAGFAIVAVNDGGETFKIDQKLSNLAIRKVATDAVVSVDEATVFINKDGKSSTLFIVLGNDPEEILNDYTEHPLIEEANNQYISQWEGKKCPMIEVE